MKQWKSLAWGGLAITWGIMGGVVIYSSQQEDPFLEEVDDPSPQDSLTSPIPEKTPEVSPAVSQPEASATPPWINSQPRVTVLPRTARAEITPIPSAPSRPVPIAVGAPPVSSPAAAATYALETPMAIPVATSTATSTAISTATPIATPTAPPIETIYAATAIAPVPPVSPLAAIAPELENTAMSPETGDVPREAETKEPEAREATEATSLNQLAERVRQRTTPLAVGAACIAQKLTSLGPENLAGSGTQPTFSRSLAGKELPPGDIPSPRDLRQLDQERHPLLGSLSYRSPAKAGCPQGIALATVRL